MRREKVSLLSALSTAINAIEGELQMLRDHDMNYPGWWDDREVLLSEHNGGTEWKQIQPQEGQQ